MTALRPIGLNFISGLGLSPPDFVRLAAELGCDHVSLALAPLTANPYGAAGWSLRDDAALLSATRAAAAECGVAIAVGEVVLIRGDCDVAESARDLDLMRELGMPAVNALSLERDPARTADQLARLAEMTDARGMRLLLEFMAGPMTGSLETAAAAIAASGRPDIGLLLDCLHLARSGASPAAVAALPPASLAYLQLCDALAGPPGPGYSDEARQDRLLPGEGELPLLEYLRAVPRDLPLGLEVPQLAKASAGVPLRAILADALARTRDLLEAI